MLNPEYPAYPIVALIATVLVLVPLPWHLQAWNSGTCLFMIWSALACLNLGVNAIVWRDNVIDHAPVWCDISSHIVVAVAVAIPASSLCINRRLYKIATMRAVSLTRAERRHAIMTDLAIGLGIPLLQLIAFYIVSGHRYDIYEQIGCYPFVYNTALAFPLVYAWPIAIGLCSAVYCVLSLRAFAIRRAQFSEFLAASSSLTIGRYFRLMGLATIEIMCTIPIGAYGLSLNAKSPIYPWISFADTHFGYSRVDQFPAIVWRMSSNAITTFALTRWFTVFCALVFFAFFGFADEARRQYSKVVAPVVALYRRRFPTKQPKMPLGPSGKGIQIQSIGSMPVFVQRKPYGNDTKFIPPFEFEDSDLSPPPTAVSESYCSMVSDCGHAV